VYVNEGRLHEGMLVLHALSLGESAVAVLVERLWAALTV
jgi:hypothetical protein